MMLTSSSIQTISINEILSRYEIAGGYKGKLPRGWVSCQGFCKSDR
jgi:hypothetical protein